MLPKGIVVGLCLIAVILGKGVATGCDCIPNPQPRRALRTAAAVFAGRIFALTPNGATLRVSSAWKGVPANQELVEVMTPADTCMFLFEVDREYIVYAYREERGGALYTNICTRTNLMSRAKEDLKKLGRPQWSKEPIATPDPRPNDPASRRVETTSERMLGRPLR
jgi:hypothetical protein